MLSAAANELFRFTKNKKILPTLSIASFVGLVTTGTFLIIVDHAKVLSTCLGGLAYLFALSIPYVVFKALSARRQED